MSGVTSTPSLLQPARASGAVLVCSDALSFWGGVDPDSGVIIDAHHPERGASLAGRFVLMPGSRGSCSGSGVLLQLARRGLAPAALVFREAEDILTLGAMIAAKLFDAPLAVLRLPDADYRALAGAGSASLEGDTLRFAGYSLRLHQPGREQLALSEADRAMLAGRDGPAWQLAMEVLCGMAAAQGASGFVDVTRGHIDGCILAHDANLDFAETMLRLGARTRIPTTINAISVDREHWPLQGVPRDFGERASRLADAYVSMGALPTFTCAPYLLADTPVEGETIGWSESNAVIYANSVLGARTVKHPDYLDLFIAMTGRAPRTGVYLDAARRPACDIQVSLPEAYDDALWPLLGWLVGQASPQEVPRICGLEAATPTADDLKALCAAFGTTSAAPLLHIHGHTPEGHLTPPADAPSHTITTADIACAWRGFNAAAPDVDLVAIGSPHASLQECLLLADLFEGCDRVRTKTIVTLGRQVLAAAQEQGIAASLAHAGVQILPDLCWCSITTPLFPAEAKVVMTNSGKYAHYGSALSGCEMRFGSLADCAAAAISGRAPDLPAWLQ